MTNNKRIAYYDLLNVISCFGVVCLHSNGYVHSFVKDSWWWVRVLVEVLFYYAVPVFFMLSGATLMTYRERYSTAKFIQKRFLKVVIPYLFWGCFFIGVHVLIDSSGISLGEIIMSLTTGKIVYTNYWFFIPLFLLYIFIPFLSLMVVRLNFKQITCLIAVIFIFQSLLPTIYSFLGLEFKVSMPLGGYFIYALVGYYMAVYDIEKNNKLCYAIFIFAVISMVVRYWLLYFSDEKEPMLFTYFGLYAFFPASAVFLLFKRVSISNNKVQSFFIYLAKRSYGVFLIHTFLIKLLSNVVNKENPCFLPLSALLVYSVSLIIVSILQKGRLTRFIVP